MQCPPDMIEPSFDYRAVHMKADALGGDFFSTDAGAYDGSFGRIAGQRRENLESLGVELDAVLSARKWRVRIGAK